MSSTRVIQTSGQLKLKSNSQDITFDVPSGKNVILPARTDFSACASALNAQVDLSAKQDANAHLDEFIALHGVAWNHAIPYYNETNSAFELTDSNQIQAWGNMQEANAKLTQLSSLTPSSGDLIYYDGSAIASASKSSLSIQPLNAKLTDVSGLSGMSSGDIVNWDGTNLVASSKSSLSIQPLNAKLTQISGLSPSSDDLLYYNGSAIASASKANLNIQPLNSKLSSIAGLAGTEDKYLRFDANGDVVEADGSSYDDSNVMKLTGNQAAAGHKNFTGTVSFDDNMIVQHRCEAGTGYIHYKRDRLYKQAFEDTDPHNLFPNIYYANDREIVVDVEVSAIDVDSSPKRMHVHKLSCVTLNGSILSNQHEIVYEPASGDVLTFAFTLSGSNLNCTVTQASANRYVYSVFVVDRAVTNA